MAFARLPLTAQGTIWADDGGIFLHDALAGGTLLDVFAPYEGYLHVPPRMAAEMVVTLFPVTYFAVAMNFLNCVVVALTAALDFHCSKAISPNPLVRICWTSITILVAPRPLETLGNFANVHWYPLWAVPWLLLKPAGQGLRVSSFSWRQLCGADGDPVVDVRTPVPIQIQGKAALARACWIVDWTGLPGGRAGSSTAVRPWFSAVRRASYRTCVTSVPFRQRWLLFLSH